MKYVQPLKLYEEWFKQMAKRKHWEPANRLLGLGIGDNHVNLALSDLNSMTACDEEYSLFHFGQLADKLKSVCTKEKIFIDALSKTETFEGLKYTYWDKAKTSKMREIKLKMHGLLCFGNGNLEELYEEYDPTLMLQGYLESGLTSVGALR
ncbi:hypothetical protein Dsin_014102 [Dipteronia sinensis]|uniref:Uncharacterized protein n=1 Tax=Dipteronia sinensis TaxID=43782 RepID=A0AAE0EA06_9ROSI|nr:hypothetical protein Dsin_014102 [Dipteronia sinensis]